MKPSPRFLQPTPKFAHSAAALLLVLLALFQAPHAGAAAWARSYGTAAATTEVNGTAVDASGNVYISGSFDGATLALGSVTLTRIGLLDAFVARLDSNGAVVWARNFGGTGARTCGCAIAADASGHVYLGGKFDASLSTPALTPIGTEDVFVFKLDASSGNTSWARNFGGAGASAGGNAIAADQAGNVYLSGSFWNASLGAPALTLLGSQDAFALKLDASGNTSWARNFGGAGTNAYGDAIALDSSGNVYLGGSFDASLSTPALPLIGSQDAFALKLDAAGNSVWARNYGGAGATAYGNGIAVDSSGNVYLGGYFMGADLSAPALTKIGNGDAFALKLNASGNTTWAKNFGGAGAWAFGNGIGLDSYGNVYLGGAFNGGKGGSANLSTPALTLIGGQDVFALKLNAAGKITWAKNAGGPGAWVGDGAVAADNSGNVYLGGYFLFGSLSIPAQTLIGGMDALILKETTAYVPGATSIPTLSEWGTILLAGMLGLFGLARVRRRGGATAT